MKSSVRYLTVAAIVALAACGDDSVSPGNLSEAEATELAGAIFSQSLSDALSLDYQQPAQAPDGPQMAQYTATVETTGSCPVGGEVSIAGTVDVETNDETGAGDIDFAVTLVHAACMVRGDQGTSFKLTGNPSLVFDFLMTTDGQENSSFSGSITGAVDWETDGKGDTCSVGYEFSGESSPNGFAFQTTGSVCGIDVSQSLTVSG